jgi:hypothetical protein
VPQSYAALHFASPSARGAYANKPQVDMDACTVIELLGWPPLVSGAWIRGTPPPAGCFDRLLQEAAAFLSLATCTDVRVHFGGLQCQNITTVVAWMAAHQEPAKVCSAIQPLRHGWPLEAPKYVPVTYIRSEPEPLDER